eukprot:scaffold649904_cov38-Prasinocladus_malaysianus.AAC.1
MLASSLSRKQQKGTLRAPADDRVAALERLGLGAWSQPLTRSASTPRLRSTRRLGRSKHTLDSICCG